MSSEQETGMKRLAKITMIVLLAAAAAAIVISIVFDQLQHLGVGAAVGWIAAGALMLVTILVAASWQSLPYHVKRLGKYSFLDPLKNRRRARVLNEPFPQEWLAYLRANVAIYNILSPAEQSKLQDTLRILIAEKVWEGCGGVQITDEIKVTIAAQASVLLLNLDHDYYNAVPAILIYPTGFMVPHEDMGRDGILQNVHVLGQAWYRGPVTLALDRAFAEGRLLHPRESLVYHEFAHQLDFMGEAGEPAADGRRPDFIETYREVMRDEYQALVRASHARTATLLDYYGATNHHEFFAVATSCFFTQARAMLVQHPRLYDVLRRFYGQDPAAREAHMLAAAEG